MPAVGRVRNPDSPSVGSVGNSDSPAVGSAGNPDFSAWGWETQGVPLTHSDPLEDHMGPSQEWQVLSQQ